MKVPPHDIDSEVAIIGSCFLNPKIISRVVQEISPSDCYREANQFIFQAIIDLGSNVDNITILDHLKSQDLLDKAGGAEYVISVCMSVPSSTGWPRYAEIVKEKSIRRKLIQKSQLIIDHALDLTTPIDEILSLDKKTIREIDGQSHGQDDFSNHALYNQLYDEVHDNRYQPGLDSGIAGIDVHHYFEPQTTTVLAAESGTGKSAFALQVSDYISKTYGKTLYFSLESTRKALARRQLARYSGVALSRIKNRNIETPYYEENIQNAIDLLIKSNLVLIDSSQYQNIDKACSFCESVSIDTKLSLIVFDYLQLMSSSEKQQSRHHELSYISKRMNYLAKDLNCPVMYVSQLTKDVDGQRPRLLMIKESGDIRNNADNIMFLWAPDPSLAVYQVECYTLKGKDQELFSVWLEFNGHYQRFIEGEKPENLKKDNSRGFNR